MKTSSEMKADLLETRDGQDCSAELHSAVSQIFNLQRVGRFQRSWRNSRPAECNSAIQQIENLRYENVRYDADGLSCHALLHFQSVIARHKRALTGLFTT